MLSRRDNQLHHAGLVVTRRRPVRPGKNVMVNNAVYGGTAEGSPGKQGERRRTRFVQRCAALVDRHACYLSRL